MVTFFFRNQTTVITAFNLIDNLLRIVDDGLLLRRHDNVGDCNGHTGYAGVVITEVLNIIDNVRRFRSTKSVVALGNELAQFLLVHEHAQAPLVGFFILVEVTDFFRQDFVENHAAQRGLNQTITIDAALNSGLQIEVMLLISEQRFGNTGQHLAFATGTGANLRQVIGTQNHVLRRNDNRLTILRCKDMVGSQHQNAGFRLCFGGQRQMDSHLVTVEVGVVCRTSQRMQLQCAAFGEYRLECLNTKAMQRRGTVQENWMLFNNAFQLIPNFRLGTLYHAFCRFNIMCLTGSDQPLHNKRLKEFQSHFLRQAALMEFQFRAYDDNGTAGVVNALTQEVLTETALLTFQHIGKGFERTVARARNRTAAAAVVDQGVNSFLQHAFLVAHDDIRCTEVEQALQTVVTVDYTTIEVVEVGRCEAAAIELYHRAQFRRNDRHNIHDHPGWLVAGLAECFHNFQTTDGANLLLTGSRADFLAQNFAHALQIELIEQFLDGFGTHANTEGVAIFFQSIVVFFFGKQTLFRQIRVFTGIEYDVISKVENLFQSTRADV